MSEGREGRKLIVHVGHQKTGTTTIQTALATGKITLARGRILYPARMAHNYLQPQVERYALTGKVAEGRAGMPGLRDLAAQLAAGGYDHAVISGERFADSDPAQLGRAMADFLLPHVGQHLVLCYLRPHAARVLSSFAERTKLGLEAGSVEAFHRKSLARKRFIYAAKLAPWVECFGQRLAVRPVVREELAGGSVLEDFAVTAFGEAASPRIAAMANSNESLCLEDLALLAVVQRAFGEGMQKVRHELGWALAQILSDQAGMAERRTKLRMHRALAEVIRRDYLVDARRSDRQFFGGRPVLERELERAVEEAVPEPMPLRPEDHFSASELRSIEALAVLLRMVCEREPAKLAGYLLDRRAERLVEEAPQADAASVALTRAVGAGRGGSRARGDHRPVRA